MFYYYIPRILCILIQEKRMGAFLPKNEIFRPSQRNIDGVYGKALNINRIRELTIDSFIEESAIVFEPDFQNGLMSMHHLHQIEDYFVIDAALQKWNK